MRVTLISTFLILCICTYLVLQVPGPAFGLAEDRFREGGGRRERRERLSLDLDLAVERVRPAAPAWTIAPRRSLSEVRQAARRDREGLGGSLDLE